MTSPGMSCETCRDLLIELVCDELTAENAAAVRAHALKCERCGPELEKLSGTLQASSSLGLLSPSPEVERRIMQAAREAIAGRARGPAREAAQAASYGVTAWFARLGSFAMSPQVAMASVLLLVVGIGLYALPFGRDAEPSALRATEDEADEERGAAPSPAASATATPVAEPEPQSEERKERERAVDRDLLNQGLKAASARKRAASEGELGRAPAGRISSKAGGGGASLGPSDSRSGVQAFPGAKGDSSAGAKPKLARESKELADDFGGLEGSAQNMGARPAKPAAKAEPAAGSSYAGAPPPASAPVRAPALSEAPAQAVSASAELGKSTEKRAQSATPSPLEQGVAAVKRGDHALASSLLKPLATSGAGSERSTAMLWLARSLREQGDCSGALAYYRVLTQSVTAPRSVLEEAADCQARTGNTVAARKLLDRAGAGAPSPAGKSAPAAKE